MRYIKQQVNDIIRSHIWVKRLRWGNQYLIFLSRGTAYSGATTFLRRTQFIGFRLISKILNQLLCSALPEIL